MNTMPTITRAAFAAALLFATACTGDDGAQGPEGPQGPQGPGGELPSSLDSTDKLLAGLGGSEALDQLARYRVTLDGSHLVNLEGEVFTDAPLGNYFEMTVHSDLDALTTRVDVDRDLEFFPNQLGVSSDADRQLFTFFLTDKGAWIEGRDSNEIAPDIDRRTMNSPSYGAYQKQLSLLFPYQRIRDALAANSVVDGGFDLVAGATHHVLRLGEGPGKIELLVQERTGELSALRFTESDYLRRDIEVTYTFAGWAGDTLRYPEAIFISVDGVEQGEFFIRDFAENPTFESGLLTPPADAVFEIDAEEVARGANHSQYHLAIAAAGLDLDAPSLDVLATPITNADGDDLRMWYITGESGTRTRHHSLVVEQEAGVVLFDAPVRPERGDQIIAWVKDNIGKPITHIVVSHHHFDHSAGARSVVAEGASTVVFDGTQSFFARVFAAPSTVVLDTLSKLLSPAPAKIIPVRQDAFVDLPDSVNPIRVYHVPTPHADDMLMPVVTNAASGTSLGFTVDIWNPAPFNFSFPEWARPLRAHFDTYGIDTADFIFAGGHGGVGTFAEFQAFIDALP